MLKVLYHSGDGNKKGIVLTGIMTIPLFFLVFISFYSGNGNVLSAFGEIDENVVYDITDRPKFEQTPVVCIYEPDEPRARDVIIDAWMKKIKSGIEFQNGQC